MMQQRQTIHYVCNRDEQGCVDSDMGFSHSSLDVSTFLTNK